jgi:hypothetical protein
MNQNYDEAKRMYLYYMGNAFFMSKEGDYNKYKSFNVPESMEKQWDVEITKDLEQKIQLEKNFNQLRSFCSALLSQSSGLKNIKGLDFVYNTVFVKKRYMLDTFTNILLVEIIFINADEFIKLDRKKTLSILKETLNYLISLENKEITVSKDYLNSDGTMPDNLADNELLSRILQDIKEFSDLYSRLKESGEKNVLRRLTNYITK